MSERIEVNKEQQLNKNANAKVSQGRLYSREDLLSYSQSPESLRRPKCLEHIYDSEDGRWDPDRWYTANVEPVHNSSSLTYTNGKTHRRASDRDFKKRFSPNNPVERLKNDREGIILSPQRGSFVTGCHVQAAGPPPYTRHLSLPDREDLHDDWDTKGDQDSRERPLRKVGSGRIHFEKTKSLLHSSLQDSGDNERNREFIRIRDKDRERDRKRNRDFRNESAKDKKGRLCSGDCNDFSIKDWGDRDFSDRAFRRNSRKRSSNSDKEPEWFSGGPTSQTDVIELRGFDHDDDDGGRVRKLVDGRKPQAKKDNHTGSTYPRGQSMDGCKKGMFEETSSTNKTASESICVDTKTAPQNEQRTLSNIIPDQKPGESQLQPQTLCQPMTLQQQNCRTAAGNKLFDFDQVLNVILPLDENGIRHGSRFSRFFAEPSGSVSGSDGSTLENVTASRDGNHSSSIVPSPSPAMGPMGAMQQAYLGMAHPHGQPDPQVRPQASPKCHHLVSVPNSAGDNNAAVGRSTMLPSLTALFNSAAKAGYAACRWNGHLDGSLETPDASLLSDSGTPSRSFSTQDAEAHLKAMLFVGSRQSMSPSGTESPVCLPPGAQQKVTTLSELEADMHKNLPHLGSGQVYLAADSRSSAAGAKISAFNKLLIMINAASEANQNQVKSELSSHAGYGMVPSHNEFSLAVMRNKEKQIQLLQQSLHHTHPAVQPMADGIQRQSSYLGMPQAMSTPQPNAALKLRTAMGSVLGADPVRSLIQQNPRMIMSSFSPTSQPASASALPQQQPVGSPSARSPSPLMFGQMSPAHFGTLSPIRPCRTSPVGTWNFASSLARRAVSSPTDTRSSVFSHIVNSQELSAQIKTQAPEQNECYLKLESDRSASPGPHHIIVVRPAPGALPVLPPTPQPKGASLDMFTPTSVLRKMHLDKALEKEDNMVDIKKEDIELMPSMHDPEDKNHDMPVDAPEKPEPKLAGNLHGLSFMYPVNPNLAPVGGQLDNQTRPRQSETTTDLLTQPMSVGGQPDNQERPGQSETTTDLLTQPTPVGGQLENQTRPEQEEPTADPLAQPVSVSDQVDNQARPEQEEPTADPLTQPMSVAGQLDNQASPGQRVATTDEDRVKLLPQSENPGSLSQMLDKANPIPGTDGETDTDGQARPVQKAEEHSQDVAVQQQQQDVPSQSQLGQTPQSTGIHSCRAVIGAGADVQSLPDSSQPDMAPHAPGGRVLTGRAIVGRSCCFQPLTNIQPVHHKVDSLQVWEQQQHFHRMQPVPRCQGVLLPSPPVRPLVPCLGPAHHMAVPVSYQIPLSGRPAEVGCGLLQHQLLAANSHQGPPVSHMMAMRYSQQQQQHCLSHPPAAQMMVMAGVSSQPSSYGQTSGPLSMATLRSAIQRLAVPGGVLNMYGSHQPAATAHSGVGHQVDMTAGIQRWFSSDMLTTQLPSLPTLPSHGAQVMTVDEVERS